MPETTTLALFLAAAVALVVVPGPSILYIVARGIDQGRAAAVVSVLGVETGSLVHVLAATLGLSALLATSAVAFGVVKFAGAAYLIYLGLRTLLSPPPAASASPIAPRSLRRIYGQGIIVQVFNPKVALFFLAFIPQFVDPRRGPVPAQTLLFGGILVATGIVISGAYALAAGSAGGWLRRNAGFARAQRWVAGSVYLGLGVATAVAGTGREHR